MRAKVCGIEINYELSGKGACLILIHGFSDNLTMWYNQVPVFSKKFKVLRYDVRGHGQTETSEGDFSMELFAEDLYGLLRALEIEKACVLGYSMGGRIGLQFALKHPEMITGLVLANSGVIGPDVKLTAQQISEMEERRKQMMDTLAIGDIELIAEEMTERSLSPGLKERAPDVFQDYKEVKLRNSSRHYLEIMQALTAAMANPPDLRQLRCPILIIAGEYDSLTPVDAVFSMAKAIPDAAVRILPTGHASAIEAPEAFNQAVLEFISQL